MIDPLERWRELGLPDKPDYAGLLTYRRLPVHAGPGRARGCRRRDRRCADGRPHLRPARHPVRSARDPRRELPAGAAPRGEGRRDGRAPGDRLRRRTGRPVRPGRQPRRDRADGRPGRRGGRDPDRPRRRPLDRRAGREGGGRGLTVPVALVHFDTHTDTGEEVFGVEISHGTPMYRLVRDGHVDRVPLRPDRPARLLARREGVRAGRRSTGSRASSCTTSATAGSARSSRRRSRSSARRRRS